MAKENERGSKKTINIQRSHSYHRSGRWSNEPKPQHLWVLDAAETANRTLGRASSVDEISQALTPKDATALLKIYGTDLTTTISKILGLLTSRKKVFVAGFSGKKKYYGVIGVLDPKNAKLPESLKSRRSRVLEIVKNAVEVSRQALRLPDILEFVDGRPEYRDLTPEMISQSVMSLKQTGELKAISIRGDGNGFHLYLPSALSIENYSPAKSLTWLEFVMSIFNDVWKQHNNDALLNGQLPLPVTTGEIRTKIAESGEFSHKLVDPKILVGAMQQLANSGNPSIRKIRRPNQKAVLWLPVETVKTDAELGIAYAHDTERVGEAVRRASVRLGRPVNLMEIEEEFKIDPSLEPASASKYHRLLADVSKVRAGSGKGEERRSRVNRRLYRVGNIDGHAYFYPEDSPGAAGFVSFRKMELLWERLCFEEQSNEIGCCRLPSVVAGRLKLLSYNLTGILDKLTGLCALERILGVSDSKVKQFVGNVQSALREISYAACNELNRSVLPPEVENRIDGWTAEELLNVIQPFYPSARKLAKRKNIQALIGETIVKFRNPHFTVNTDKNPRCAAQFLYDVADAKIRIAKKWGGTECALQATMAANELGLLRDYRFVLPGLKSGDYENRLTAVACLAFIPSETGNDYLKNIAVNDVDPGVRGSALWAYGFAGGRYAMKFVRERMLHDTDSRVQKFAEEILFNCQDSWFEF